MHTADTICNGATALPNSVRARLNSSTMGSVSPIAKRAPHHVEDQKSHNQYGTWDDFGGSFSTNGTRVSHYP